MRVRFAFVIAATVGSIASGCGGESESSVPMETPAEESIDPTISTVRTSSATTTESATTTDAPTSWEAVTANLTGLASECGNMSWVAARQDRDMVIAGVARRGLFAQFDGSGEWVPLGANDGSATITNRTTSVVFDPDNPDRFWQSGTYNGNGVYRTDDNGSTFHQLGEVPGSDLVSVDLDDPQRRTLLSGSHERPDAYRSGDGGATWQDVSASLPEGVGYASTPHVIDAQIHLLGTNSGPAAGVYRTTDAGETWTLVRPGGVRGAPLVVDDTIWWLMELGGGVISSSDGGETWSEAGSGDRIFRYAASLVALPGDRIATVGQGYVVVSADGGETWSTVGAPLPYDPSGLAYSPVSDTFYVWRFVCDFDTDNPIATDSIMALERALQN